MKDPNDEKLDALIKELEKIPLKEAQFTISVNKSYYPKVLYARTLEQAMTVFDFLKKMEMPYVEGKEADLVEVTVTQILDRAVYENNYTI